MGEMILKSDLVDICGKPIHSFMSLSVDTCKLYFVFIHRYDNISVNMNNMISLCVSN